MIKRSRSDPAFLTVFERVHLPPGGRLLDVGFGIGTITVGFADLVATGEVIGIDVEPTQLERAQALAIERRVTNVRFEVADVYRLPFPDGSFDAAYANSLLQHLADPVAALREVHRVLRPGGVVGVRDAGYS